MPREHGDGGEFVETVTHSDVLGIFDTVDGPVILSADVADELGCSRETARRKLEALFEQEQLARRKVSRRVIYWQPESETDSDASESDSDTDSMPTVEDGLNPDAVRQDVVKDE
jgi:hypothetical protein